MNEYPQRQRDQKDGTKTLETRAVANKRAEQDDTGSAQAKDQELGKYVRPRMSE